MYLDKEKAALIGRLGEDYVANYLKNKGAIIIKRNYKSRYGELDIVADDNKNIIFVEVKTRSEGAIVSGLEAVDVYKQNRTKNAAMMFMKKLHTDLPPRIDVAEVTVREDGEGKYKGHLKYYKNAF